MRGDVKLLKFDFWNIRIGSARHPGSTKWSY